MLPESGFVLLAQKGIQELIRPNCTYITPRGFVQSILLAFGSDIFAMDTRNRRVLLKEPVTHVNNIHQILCNYQTVLFVLLFCLC